MTMDQMINTWKNRAQEYLENGNHQCADLLNQCADDLEKIMSQPKPMMSLQAIIKEMRRDADHLRESGRNVQAKQIETYVDQLAAILATIKETK